MKKRRVISRKSLPVGLPVLRTVVLILVLDRVGAPGWVWGVAATLMALLWIASVALVIEQKGVDVFAADDTPPAAAAPLHYDFGGSRPTNPIYDSLKVGST